MAKSENDQWRRGHLRVFLRQGERRVEIPDLAAEHVLLRPGWAIPASVFEEGFTFNDDPHRWPGGVPGLGGIRLDFAIRDGSFRCVGIHSNEDGPAITPGLLRKLEPHVRKWTRAYFLGVIHRLIKLEDGTIAGEIPFATRSDFPADVELDFERDVLDADVLPLYKETGPRPGKRPLSEEHLRRVAELFTEAEELGLPRSSHIASEYPDRDRATIRNWIRYARRRDDPLTGEKFLGPAPATRRAGEQRKDENDG
jgi:hypothetical protein